MKYWKKERFRLTLIKWVFLFIKKYSKWIQVCKDFNVHAGALFQAEA